MSNNFIGRVSKSRKQIKIKEKKKKTMKKNNYIKGIIPKIITLVAKQEEKERKKEGYYSTPNFLGGRGNSEKERWVLIICGTVSLIK